MIRYLYIITVTPMKLTSPKILNKIALSLILTSPLVAKSQILSPNYHRFDSIPVSINGHQLAFPWVGGFNSPQFGEMDLNFDGIMDLVIFDRTTDGIHTFLNEGIADSISYKYAPEYIPFFPPMFNWVRFADYNCDGKVDLYTSTPGGMKVFRNVGTTHPEFVVASPFLYGMQYSNFLNIYVSSTDLPGIADVDGDGDIDILSMGVLGTAMEYHKNMSMELYGHCDSLVYEMKNACFGGFVESPLSNQITLNYVGWPCTTGNVNNPEFDLLVVEDSITRELRHSGTTILIYDMDEDGISDLVLGGVDFPNLTMLQNSGTGVNQNNLMVYYDPLYPNYDISADVHTFPGAFYLDVNNDGVKDMLAAPNCKSGCVDKESIWYYQNDGITDNPDLVFKQTNFLQSEMIEHGTGAYPVFFDFDNDGLLDLFVSNMGIYNHITGVYEPSVAQYKNTGTSTQPHFTLITEDFENLSTMGLPIGLYPAFGDMDGDGDKDMIIGDGEGNLHYFQNIASSGQPANFVLAMPLIKDQSNATIDVGMFATPQILDIDRDGKLDIVVGNRLGELFYIRNKGTVNIPVWEIMSTKFGNIDVKEWFEKPFGSGYSVPFIYDNNGNYEILVGTKRGTIWQYNNIENNLGGTFDLVDSTFQNIQDGVQSSIALADLNSDGFFEIITGNYRGGLSLYKRGTGPTGISTQLEIPIKVWPNPSNDNIFVQLPGVGSGIFILELYDQTGRIVSSISSRPGQIVQIQTEQLASGIYFLREASNQYKPSKVILQK